MISYTELDDKWGQVNANRGRPQVFGYGEPVHQIECGISTLRGQFRNTVNAGRLDSVSVSPVIGFDGCQTKDAHTPNFSERESALNRQGCSDWFLQLILSLNLRN